MASKSNAGFKSHFTAQDEVDKEMRSKCASIYVCMRVCTYVCMYVGR